MRETKTHGLSHRLTAALLCLCMVASMLSGVHVRQAYAAAAGETKHIVENSRVADPDTMDDYLNRLLTEASGSRYAGRVWTDKSVFAYGDNSRASSTKNPSHFDGTNKITLDMATDGYVGDVLFNADFAHVFSALASSQVVNEYPPSPVDLVIVFDMSGSMGQDTRFNIDSGVNTYVKASDPNYPANGVLMSDRIANSRIQKTLDAINQTIDTLMAQNPQNRVAVCGYGENATVLMPLGHYKRVDKDNDGTLDSYLSVGGMETLYHPSDLVYRAGRGDELDGWYWMNNRDTCYTVVVNAETNNYTGILNDNGDGDGRKDCDPAVDKWHSINKTVSNNVLNSSGEPVKAFPGVAVQDANGLASSASTFGSTSQTVYNNAKNNDPGYSHGTEATAMKNAIAGTRGLQANDYVGYFTNTQGGIYLAYKQLADSTVTTYTEPLSNGVISTVARIPAAIVMSDGGANFSFNEMGITAGENGAAQWNSRYGQPVDPHAAPGSDMTWYIEDNSWLFNNFPGGGLDEAQQKQLKDSIAIADRSHRLGGCIGEGGAVEATQTGDEWYKVFLPGKDTLGNKWDGVHGIYNLGADYYKDGTLTSQPVWDRPGVLYSSDNTIMGTSGTVMEVLLTAGYMNYVVKEHYNNGWVADGAAEDSRIQLSTYTMNVDTNHVPLWGRMRLFPSLDPSGHSIDKVEDWYETVCSEDELNQFIETTYGGYAGQLKNHVTNEKLFITGDDGGVEKGGYTGLQQAWNDWCSGKASTATVSSSVISPDSRVDIKIAPISANPSGASYESTIETKDGKELKQAIAVDDQKVKDNIAYNDGFYDVTSEDMGETFEEILGLILGKVFVPVSGDNDAGVGDSITYQDPLGEYMEIKNQSITTQAHKDSTPTDYDMALLLFGEMHGLVRVGVYDYQWNDAYMNAHPDEGAHGKNPFPMGWYWGDDPAKAVKATDTDNDGAGTYPLHSVDGSKNYDNANEARADGWVFRVNFQTLIQFVPIVDAPTSGLPEDLTPQVMNTKYTLYRFAGDTDDRNELRRNPIYGDVPADIQKAWEDACNALGNGQYPQDNKIYASTPGVYRLSDIRVWVEDTGDYVDTEGAIAPNSGYDRSLYVNIPAAAIPTELATITLGRDGVLSYETNLGKDHPVGSQITVEKDGKKDTHYVTADEYNNFCYQSTPFRLFYAVGLEEDLILRDDDGNQTGVDFNAISPEYISSHTVAGQDYVWFISNYYSETRYDEYASDTVSRTRGDPTVTFSPGSDNRYYVFQKPLPLFAHAYRAPGGGLTPVDGTGFGAHKEGNGSSTWENYNGAQQQAGSWAGGQYMGTYKDETAFQTAYAAAQAEGKGTITDSSGIKYEYVKDGIVFLQEDMLRHVTSNSTGSGYTDDSISFSSDDYFFLLVEFYVPDEGTGVDNKNQEVPGTQKGHMVQYALARKGSEFGSGFASSEIDNGDMLCWTDAQNHLNLEFDYLSKTDTGDLTRGEPTYKKLTESNQVALKEYLRDECHISETTQVPNPDYVSPTETPHETSTISVLEQQVRYWLKMQSDSLVVAALNAAAEGHGTPSESQFEKYFSFSVAARPGGIRSGDMSNNVQYKGAEYDEKTGYYNNNVTKTSNTYYLPTVSDNSGTDDSVIINNYLGNNGRLEIANQMLHVTKMLEPPAGYELTDAQKDVEFNYQIFVQGVTGIRTAVRTEYNEYSETWERELAYIDVLTDNSDLVQTNDSTRALFVKVEGTTSAGSGSIMARQVVLNTGDSQYYYANDNGALPTKDDGSVDESQRVPTDVIVNLYYMYLPSNGEADTGTAHVHRLYQAAGYDGDDRIESGLGKNGVTTFVRKGDPITPSLPGAENRVSQREEDVNHPAGTKTYWSLDAELIPKDEVDAEEANSLPGVAGIALESIGGWRHEDHAHDGGDPTGHQALTYHDFVIRKPSGETSETNFTSPYKTRSAYLTVVLNFGQNANKGDGGISGDSGAMQVGDLYDKIVPSVDRPDLFGSLSLDNIAQYTAEFTLKHGEGLLLTGLQNRVSYRFTEKLTDAQLKMGYTLKEIGHVQQRGSLTTYAPGANEFTDLGDGFTVVEGGETYFHTNAKLMESYSTMTGTGNHHDPDNNPACKNGNADEDMGGGSIRHYFVKNSELVDKHYTGDGFDSSRYVVNATAHFGVKEEPTESVVTTQNARTDYTGVYSVFGSTGWFEEQANFVNTFEPGNISITKDLEPYEGSVLTEQDKDTAFSFTLTLETDSGVGMPDGVYSYVVTDKDGKEVKTGRLLPKTGPTALYPPEDANDIRASDAGNTTWSFTLKGGQTMTVLDLPVDSTFTYKVTETTPGDGYNVTDSDTEPNPNDDRTVSGSVKPGSEDPVKVTFTNTKTPPKPAVVSLSLKKTVSGTGFDWTDKEFTFLVAPAAGNPEGDLFTEAKQVKITADGAMVDIFQGLQFEKPGVYTYTVKELLSTIPGVSSDGKIYTVQVDVSDAYDENGYYTGSLNAKITVNGEPMTAPITITFNNQYDKNEIRVPFQARKVLKGGVLTDRAFDFMLECTGFEPESVPMPASNSAGVPEENSTQPTQPAETQPTEPPAPSDAPESTEDTVPPETTAPTEDTVPPETTAPTEGTEPPETTEGSEPTVGEPSEIQPTEPASSEEESGPLDESRPQGEGAPINTYRFIGGLRGPMLRHSPEDVTNPTGESQPADESQPTDGADPTGEPTPTENSTEPTGEPAPTENSTEPTGEPAPTEGPTEPTGNPDDGISPASVGVGTAVTVSNDADGLIDFGSLTFTEAGTYTFKISEVAGTAPGMEYDTREYTVTVVIVRDATSGALKLESVTYDPAVPEFELPTFTNRVKTGSLTVEKQVTGEGDRTKDFRFTVTFDPKLTDPAGLTITKFDASGAATAEKFTIGADGSLVFTLKHGEKLTVTGLPVNTVYTVKEDDYSGEGYTTTITDPEGDPDGVGTIRVDQEDVVTVVNDKPTPPPTPKTGSLTVSKTVTGDGDPTKEWHFRVELSDSTVNGLYGDMNFTDGVAQVTLRSGESATATGLPEGVTYTVTELEANQDGYTTSSVGESGVIPADGVAEARFVNDKPTTPPPPPGPKTGSLTVSKTVTGDGDPTKEWHFRVELSDSSVNGLYGDMNFTDGVAQVTLRSGESATANGLPEGTAYTVTELEANQDGYTTSSDGESGVIPADGVAEARFVNNKPTPGAQYGDLIVEKIVTGAGDRTKDFRFTVTFDPADVDFSQAVITKYDAAGNPTADRFQIVDGYLEFNLKHGEKLTVRDLPMGTPYTVTELDANRDGYTTSSAGAVGTIPYGVTTARFANDLPTTPPPPTTPTTPMPSTTPDDTPKTGDGSALGLWMALAILSLLCAGWMALTLAKAIPQKRRHS